MREYTYQELMVKIFKSEKSLENLKSKLKEVCPHINVRHTFHQDHDSSTFQGTVFLNCHDCNTTSSDDDKESERYKRLYDAYHYRKKMGYS